MCTISFVSEREREREREKQREERNGKGCNRENRLGPPSSSSGAEKVNPHKVDNAVTFPGKDIPSKSIICFCTDYLPTS